MSNPAVRVPLSPAANAKVQEALADFMACVEERFTGSLQVEFKEGIPLLRKRVELAHYGSASGRRGGSGG